MRTLIRRVSAFQNRQLKPFLSEDERLLLREYLTHYFVYYFSNNPLSLFDVGSFLSNSHAVNSIIITLNYSL